MKKVFSISLLAILLCGKNSFAQINVSKIIKQATAVANPSSDEIASAIKEALNNGVSSSTSKLSTADGFLKNLAVKILLPPEAQKAEKALRGLGLNQLCDTTITSLNRAAEAAAKEALPIFVSSIKQMQFSDAKNILLSREKDAGTQYFKGATTEQLTAAFKPIIQSSLNKVGSTKYWAEFTTRYNKIPFASKINPDLNAYVTQKALDGLFLEIASEELKIRDNSVFRQSALLQKVFGYADKLK